MSSQLVWPNLTLRTMQLNAWVANKFMNIEILFLLTSYTIILQCYNPKMLKITLHSVCTAEYLVSTDNNKQNAWATDNLAPLYMLILSIIA